MSYAKFIKAQREQLGLTYDEMAGMAKMSRSSYFSLERGDKKLSLEEAVRISKIFGVTVEELLTGILPDYDKYRQMILAFLRKAKGNGATLKKTKLAKLLYFADFTWYFNHLQSMSGLAYRKIEYGPVPDAYFRILDEMDEQSRLTVQKKEVEGKTMYEISETFISEIEQLNLLSNEELILIDTIWDKWKNANTNQIVQYTHNQFPYKNVEIDQIIPYELILQEKAEYVF
jgi:transcriptional regulator with XRE-family HTH domain